MLPFIPTATPGLWRLVVPVLTLCCLTACIDGPLLRGGGGGGFAYNDVDGSDSSTLTPVVRARTQISRFLELEPQEDGTMFLEAAASTVEGGFDQRVGSSLIGGVPVNGNLDVDYRLSQVTIALGHQVQFDDVFRGALFGGPSYHDVSMDVGWTGGTASQTKNGFGAVIGGQIDARAGESWGGYARGDFTLLPAKSHSIKVELGLEVEVTSHTALLLGYRWWKYLHDHGTTGLSLETRGLLAGMRIDF